MVSRQLHQPGRLQAAVTAVTVGFRRSSGEGGGKFQWLNWGALRLACKYGTVIQISCTTWSYIHAPSLAQSSGPVAALSAEPTYQPWMRPT
jgi:hypothetical protein